MCWKHGDTRRPASALAERFACSAASGAQTRPSSSVKHGKVRSGAEEGDTDAVSEAVGCGDDEAAASRDGDDARVDDASLLRLAPGQLVEGDTLDAARVGETVRATTLPVVTAPELAGDAVALGRVATVAAAVVPLPPPPLAVGAPPSATRRRTGAARTMPRNTLNAPLPSSIQLLVADGLGCAGTNEPEALTEGDGEKLRLLEPLGLALLLVLPLGDTEGGPDREGVALDVRVMVGVMEPVGDALGEREGGGDRLGLPLHVMLALGDAPRLGLAVGLGVPDVLAVWLGEGLALALELGEGDGSACGPRHGAMPPPPAEGS